MYFSSIEGLNLAILGKTGDFERDQNQKFIFFWSVSVILTVIKIPNPFLGSKEEALDGTLECMVWCNVAIIIQTCSYA